MLLVHVRRPSWDCENENEDSLYLISHDKQILLMGEVQHLLYTLLTLHLTYSRTKTIRVVPEVQPRVPLLFGLLYLSLPVGFPGLMMQRTLGWQCCLAAW